ENKSEVDTLGRLSLRGVLSDRRFPLVSYRPVLFEGDTGITLRHHKRCGRAVDVGRRVIEDRQHCRVSSEPRSDPHLDGGVVSGQDLATRPRVSKSTHPYLT